VLLRAVAHVETAVTAQNSDRELGEIVGGKEGGGVHRRMIGKGGRDE
jgi:hypothetical protein